MKTKNAMQLKAMIKRVSIQKNISPQLAMQLSLRLHLKELPKKEAVLMQSGNGKM